MRPRFLIVDGDRAYAENLAELVEVSGYSSERATSAAEARRLAAAKLFDAALVDLALPDALGSDLVAELKTRSPSLVAIVFTGHPTVGSAREAIRTGAAAYLLKDGDPRELEQAILRTGKQAAMAHALAEIETRYALLVERAPLGIALVKGGLYTFANDRYARIFGFTTPSVLVGLPVEDVYHPDDRPRVRDHWRFDRGTWEETYARHGVRRADGRPIDLLVTRARFELEGGTAVQLVVRDTTEETRLSHDLDEARNQLEDKRRLAALGEMVAGIAHEIRNPLQGVSWGVNELRAFCKKQGDAAAHEALEKIASSTREIEAIVAEVLDYARPMKLERISFSARDLLVSTQEDVTAQADAVGVRIELAGEDFEAVLDPLKVKQALVNLARNAIEASPRGSRVVLRAAKVVKDKAPLARFEVEDEGSGVADDLREKIFLPFVTTKVKGTGLGLAVVRRVTDAHGGDVRLEPREPRGTLARIELPAT